MTRENRQPTALPALLLTCAALLPAGLTGQVPTPASVFGFEPGTDYKLADYGQIQSYFLALDEASDRVVLEQIGETTLGKPMYLALISSEENLRNRDRYREMSERLARAEGLSEQEARRFARDGKAVVWIDGGLHATEVAGGQMTPLLAYWAATDEGEEARRIRENVIFLLMPNMNPDGLDIVADWYRKNVGTPFETAPVPELYHAYIGHDNNRDWYMFTQVETQAVANQLYHVWFPQIVYNHHQRGPFPGRIWTPPFENPVNPNLDPEVVTRINHIGEAMKKRFNEEDKPGVSSGIVYDMWWNGSMRGAPDFHNMLGFLSETALYHYATPHCYGREEIPETFGERAGNLPALRPTTNYTDPWLGGCWHFRDPVEYMLTASRAVLDQAARRKDDYLYGIYRIGRRQIARGERGEGGPFAYVIDLEGQHDPGAAVALLRIFRRGGIEIHQANQAFAAGGKRYEAGVYVIGPQAFRPFVVDLMEPKHYPDRRLYPGGPPEPPYDLTGYELSLQMGVKADRVEEPFPLPGPAVDEVPSAAGGVRGEGGWGWALSPASNDASRAVNELLEGDERMFRATGTFQAAGRSWPSGTWVVRGGEPDRLASLGKELGQTFHALSAAPTAPLREVRTPRIGLYRGHTGNMPEGWTRWILEQYGFRYRSLSNDEIRAGDFGDLDVIILPDQDADDILNGHRPGTMPPEYVGGVGVEGAAALRRWVERGGWVLALDHGADFPTQQFGLPLLNAVSEARPEEFFIPGSLVRIQVDAPDPLGWGMPESAIAFFVQSQVFRVVPPASAGEQQVEREMTVFARYAERNPLASGWANGAERYLAGAPTGLRVPLGRGQVVLVGFEPHFRGQPHNTFKLLFNPLYAATMEGTAPDDDGGTGSAGQGEDR